MAELYTERDGRELAVQMLHELMHAGADVCAIESKYRDGAPNSTRSLVISPSCAIVRAQSLMPDSRRSSPTLSASISTAATDSIRLSKRSKT